MRIFEFGVLAAIVCGFFAAVWWNLSLPTVYASPSEEIICVVDSKGNQIPAESLGRKYHFEYAQWCPVQ